MNENFTGPYGFQTDVHTAYSMQIQICMNTFALFKDFINDNYYNYYAVAYFLLLLVRLIVPFLWYKEKCQIITLRTESAAEMMPSSFIPTCTVKRQKKLGLRMLFFPRHCHPFERRGVGYLSFLTT